MSATVSSTLCGIGEERILGEGKVQPGSHPNGIASFEFRSADDYSGSVKVQSNQPADLVTALLTAAAGIADQVPADATEREAWTLLLQRIAYPVRSVSGAAA